MVAEVPPTGLFDLEVLSGVPLGSGLEDTICGTLGLSVNVGLDVLVGLLDITSDVKGISGGLRDGETV